MTIEEIKKELDIAREKEQEASDELNRLAKESLNAGVNFSDNHSLLRQGRIVDDCTITVKKLEEMLENCEE